MPVSAPSWGLQNELQYLRDHPAVLRAIDRIVIVSNSGDFAKPSSWASEVSHPRSPPVSALFTLARKMLVNSDTASQRPPPAALRVPPRDNVADFAAFAAAFPRPVTVVVYPNKAEAAGADPCGYLRPAPYRGFANVRYLCVKQDPRWSPAYYKDGIHPTVPGYGVLSAIVADDLARGAQPAPWPAAR